MKGLADVREFISGRDGFTVVSHYDADGLSAAGIASLFLKRLGKDYKVRCTKQLDAEILADLEKKGERFIFTDLGSGYVSLIEQFLNGKEFCIIDHHEPQKTDRPHFNPHLFGKDGSSELSGAGAAYLVARELDAKNTDLSFLAIVGAVGDMQDSSGKLVGMNREILLDGERAGVIDVRSDIRLFGRHSRPLTQFLSYSTEPFFPGLTADEDACREFITSLGIPLRDGETWRVYADLSEAEKKRFVSAIYVYGKERNIPEFILRSIVGEVYEFPREPMRTELRDAKEFSTLLNACGRHEHADLGVAVCAGDRGEGLAAARSLLQKHRKMLRDGIEWAQKVGTRTMGSIYVLDCDKNIKDTLVGVIAGMLYGAQVIGQDRPVIALAVDDNGDLKISARATWSLVRRGLDLGAAMRLAAAACNGIGGGHTIAAGARVKPDMKEKFLEEADAIIGKQLKKSA